jgi:hypothetical protein
MGIQGGNAGIVQYMTYRYVATEGQTTFSGPDAQGFVLSYTPGFLLALCNGHILSSPDFTATDGSTVTYAAPMTSGHEIMLISLPPFNPANTYTQNQSDILYNRRRNRIIDGGMRVSQEQGNNLLTTSTAITYPSDSFFGYRATGGAATIQRIAQLTPGGSPYRIRMTVTAVNSNPSGPDCLFFGTKIEGLDIADLRFGTTSARTIAIRIGCRSSVAGTYAISIINGATNRSWLGTIVIAPAEVGIDVVKSVTLTGDITGTWATDNTTGMQINVCLSSASPTQGVPGWQSGSLVGTSNSTNLMATLGATFDLFDVGLYDVTGMTPGAIPQFELESYISDVVKCQRYYIQQVGNQRFYAPSPNLWGESGIFLPVPPRVMPSITLVTVGIQNNNIAGSPTTIASGSNNSGNYGYRFSVQAAAAGDTYALGYTYAFNARL